MEYDYSYAGTGEHLKQDANEMSKEGWRLLTVTWNGTSYLIVFQREIVVLRDDPPM